MAYLIAAGTGVLLAWFLSRDPEVRSWRLSQLVLVPGAFLFLVFVYQASDGKPDTGAGVVMVLTITLTAFFLAPNIAFYLGVGVSNFLDPMDWTPAEQEIALRPIRRLIDKNRFYQALGDLEGLIKTHRPSYEAFLLYANLLHHFGRTEDAGVALSKAIPICHTADQQLAVAQLLAALPEPSVPTPAPAAGVRRLRIAHELILFPPGAKGWSDYKIISPGEYPLREMVQGRWLWRIVSGENWGNAALCWEAVREMDRPAPAPPKKGFLSWIVRIHQRISTTIKGRPRLYAQADADKLFKEAAGFIRQENWSAALPLLEKANTIDPHRYEIAYRWVQAVRQTAGRPAAGVAVNKVLGQYQWSENEKEMLEQLRTEPPR